MDGASVTTEISVVEEFDAAGRSVRQIAHLGDIEQRIEYSYACAEPSRRHRPFRLARCNEEYTADPGDQACWERRDRCDNALRYVDGWG